MAEPMLNGRTVLVTGASGFIGTHLCRALQLHGVTVHGVSRRARPHGGGMQWWQSDLADVDETRTLLKSIRPQLVFHLASHVAGSRALALVPSMFQANLQSTVNLLTAATEQGGMRLVMTGSLEEPLPEASWALPSSPYACAKYAASTYARMFHRLYQTPVVLLRLYMVYGPGQQDENKLIPYVIRSLFEGRAPELSSGQRQVDWIYVDDVVRALLLAGTAAGIDGKTLDIGSGTLHTVRAVVDQLVRRIDPSITPRFGALAERPYEQERAAEVAASTAAIGWRPQTDLADGLARTIEWYRAQFHRNPLTTQVV
jgi:UDP-glucose 4-epimerase